MANQPQQITLADMAVKGIKVQGGASYSSLDHAFMVEDLSVLDAFKIGSSVYHFPFTSAIISGSNGYAFAERAVLASEIVPGKWIKGSFPVRALGPNERIVKQPISNTLTIVRDDVTGPAVGGADTEVLARIEEKLDRIIAKVGA